MTQPRDLEALVSAYLAPGMEVLPNRVVDSVLDEVHRTRQRRVGHGPWRTRPMLRATFATAALAAALVVAGSIYLIGPPRVTPTAAPSASLPGIVAPSSTPSATGPTSSAFPRGEGTWIPTGTMGTPRSDPTAIRLLDGRVLVLGSHPAEGSDDAVSSGELYDPQSGTWSATASMLKPYYGFPPTLLRDGRVFVGTEVYDPETGTWTATGNVSWRSGATSTLLNDGTVLVRSDTGSLLFDPSSWTWTATRSMASQRHSNAAILLPDGRVLVAGGHAPGDFPTATAELYDPDTGTWSATASMHTPRETIQAFLQPDGRVLVVGGSRGDPHSAEVYDPATEAWTVSGGTSRPGISVNAGATMLSDGRVLVRSGTVDVDAALYDPGTGSWTPAAPMLRSHGSPAVLLLDGTVLAMGGEDCLDGVCVATGGAELYVPDGVSPPPLPAFSMPPPPVIPSPTPAPTLFPPKAGPVPPDARTWTVRVVNDSPDPATLFVSERNTQGILGRLVGSVTPNVVLPGATVQATFLLPANASRAWVIFVSPRPGGDGPLLGEAEVALALEIRITADGESTWLSP